MKRLFTAIEVHPGTAFMDQFRKLKLQLGHEGIKWVEEHNVHITLKFLGETEESRIPGICRVLEEVASVTDGFSFSLKNLGIFGSSYDPRVIWVGIEPFNDLASLMRVIRERMASVGFEPDRQNLVPHLTLGRIKFINDKKRFREIIAQNKGICSDEFRADRIILFESILKKEGPEYLVLQTFQLKG
jgi:RNA 2',3'-cyclic 3'-phosphodiesterase